jgi:hypothetical protein
LANKYGKFVEQLLRIEEALRDPPDEGEKP